MSEDKSMFCYSGRSMWPVFQEGDLLKVLPTKTNKIRRGDCIAFQLNNEKFVTHRVVVAGSSFTTRGDALPTVDSETVKAEQVIGKVVRVYRMGRPIKVLGGTAGRVTGKLYNYAGRIDPQRTSRGGRLAIRIRSLVSPCLRLCRFPSETRVLRRPGKPDMTIWKVGGATVGRLNPLTDEWSVAWPWNIVLEHPDQT